MRYPGQKYRQQQGAMPAPINQGYGQPPQQGNQGYNVPPGQGYNPGYGAPPSQDYNPGYSAPPNQGYNPGYGASPNQGYNPGHSAPPSQEYNQGYGSSNQGLPGGGVPMPTPSTSSSFSQQPPHGNNYQSDFPQPSHHPPQQIGQPSLFPVPDYSSAGQQNNFNFPPQPPSQGMGQPSLFPAPNFNNVGRQSNFNLPPQPPPQNQALFNQPPPTQQAPPSQPLPPGANSLIPVSNFSGRKKALLIGINYYGTKAELRGCINDVKNIRDFICRHYSFSTDSMVILTDDQKHDPSRIPTRENIIQAMKWLVSDARPNDSLFFHFSGHGSQQKDTDGDEEDGYDETICPVDFKGAGMIVDDEMNAIMVQPLPPGCRLTAIFDCCHSGTALDLPYTYDQHGKLISYSPAKKVKSAALDLGKKYLMGDMVGALMSLKNGVSAFKSGKNAQKVSQATRGTLADVVMFSGCEDSQTSADAVEHGIGNTGAMSFALIKALSGNPYGLSYLQLLDQIRAILRGKYSQVPQLSSGRPMDMNQYFSM